MRKIPTLFKRNFETHKIYNEITEGCEWALKEGMATRKFDGTACLVRDGVLYKRYDCKKGRKQPREGFSCQSEPDPETGHWPCWILVTASPEDKYHREALTGNESDGIYKLCGPKINGNPEGYGYHVLVRHGILKYPQCPATFDGIKEFLIKEKIEGIVIYRDNGEMCKVKLKDYGIKRR